MFARRLPLRATAVVLAGLTLVLPAGAGPRPGVTRQPTALPPMTDVMLARAALAVLDADPATSRVNLIVSVSDRVALLGGPVPAADIAAQAERLVRGVPGVADVRNRCFVFAHRDPLLKAVADITRPADRRPVELPGVLPGWKPTAVAAAWPAFPPPADPSTRVSLKPTAPAATFLLDPAGPAGPSTAGDAVAWSPVEPKANDVAPGHLTARPTAPPARSTADTLWDVAAVRDADPRFRELTVELRAGTLTVGGAAGRLTDAWQFARAAEGVTGVRRAVVGPVRVK